MAYNSDGLPVMDSGVVDIDPSWTSDWSTLPDFETGGGDPWYTDLWNFIGSDTAKSLLSFGSGIYGLYQSDKMKDLARAAYGASDPFGSQRGIYASQLAALMKDPSTIAEDPGYKFQRDQGEQAIVRQMASKGYLGSGNMGTALVQYSQDYANKYLTEKARFLAELAGAGISPNFGAAMSGYASGIDTASSSLASLGYGATMAGGSGQSRPNSAGGEAAKIGGAASSAGNLISKAGGKTVGGYLSNAGSVISGISQGGTKGYGQAISGAANLAEMAGYGGTTTNVAGAAGNLASGNYVGAAKDLYGLYTGAGAGAGATLGAAGSGAGAGFAAGAGEAFGAGASSAITGTSTAVGSTAATGGGAAAGAGGGSAMSALGAVGQAAGVAVALIAAGQLAVKAWGGGGSQTRNLASFEAALGEQLEKKQFLVGRTPVNLYKIPGKDFWLTMDQFKKLAGSWYGAAFAPDGDQEGWQKKLEDTWNTLQPVDLSKYGIKP